MYETPHRIMQKTNLICYELPKTKPTTRTKLHRELYGYIDISNHGKYTYPREGLLAKINGQRIMDAVLLITKQHTNKIIKLLQKHGARTHLFNLTRTKQ